MPTRKSSGPVIKDPVKKNPAVKPNPAPGGKIYGNWQPAATARIRSVKQ